MSILSGYGKFKRYVLTDSGYKLCSQWTSSNTVHFDDGKTAQTKLGAISGITDSLTATNSNIALSAVAGKNLQDQLTALNTDLSAIHIAAIVIKDYIITPTSNNQVVTLDYDISDVIPDDCVLHMMLGSQILYFDSHRYQQVTITDITDKKGTAHIACQNTVPFKIRIYTAVMKKRT